MKRLFVPRLKCRAQTFDCYTIHTVLFDLDKIWVLGCCCSFHYLTALLRRYSHTHFLCSLRLFSFKLSVRFKLLFEHYKIAKQFHFEIYLNLKNSFSHPRASAQVSILIHIFCRILLLKVHTFDVLLLLSADPLFSFFVLLKVN